MEQLRNGVLDLSKIDKFLNSDTSNSAALEYVETAKKLETEVSNFCSELQRLKDGMLQSWHLRQTIDVYHDSTQTHYDALIEAQAKMRQSESAYTYDDLSDYIEGVDHMDDIVEMLSMYAQEKQVSENSLFSSIDLQSMLHQEWKSAEQTVDRQLSTSVMSYLQHISKKGELALQLAEHQAIGIIFRQKIEEMSGKSIKQFVELEF